MAKQNNVEIFQETKRLYSSDEDLIRAVEDAVRKQKVYIIPPEIKEPGKSAVTVSSKRTLEAASAYKGKTVVLNFASARYPGGGVEAGSNAQEEALCRISTLYPCLCNKGVRADFYDYHNKTSSSVYSDRIIYTPDVVVFREDDNDMKVLPKNKWWKVDVITSPAPNRSAMYGANPDELDEYLAEIFASRFKAILSVAKDNGAENVILGAFGCGVFGNDPYMVAECAKEALKNYTFKNVEFAVFCTPWDSRNYSAFKDVFADARIYELSPRQDGFGRSLF